jgi:hypothetical protein
VHVDVVKFLVQLNSASVSGTGQVLNGGAGVAVGGDNVGSKR